MKKTLIMSFRPKRRNLVGIKSKLHIKKKIQVVYVGFTILNFQLITHNSFSQNVGINSDGSAAETSTMLDIKSAGTTSSTFGIKVKNSEASDMFVVRSDGFAGIGTNNPGRNLVVLGSTGILLNSGTTAPSSVNIMSTVGGRWHLTGPREDGNNSLYIMKYDNSDVNQGVKMAFQENGNVGIGTTSPNNRLTLPHSSSIGWEYSSGDSQVYHSVGKNSDGAGALEFKTNFSSLLTTKIYSFFGSAGGVETELISVLNGGNVGVGTTSPADKLHVDGGDLTVSSTSNPHMEVVEYSTGGQSRLRFMLNTTNSVSEINSTSFSGGGSNWPLAFLIGSSERMRLTPIGRLGIGTTAPAQTLDVNGNIAVSGTTVHTSDKRYKKDISTIQNALANISRLRGVSYQWRTEQFPEKNFENRKQLGVIAQEVESIYPELVFTDEDGYKSVDYSHLAPILIEAIKEQQQLIETQKDEIKELKLSANEFNKYKKETTLQLNMIQEHLKIAKQ